MAETIRIDNKDCFTVKEFCARNSISRTTLYEELYAGKLIARKIRGKVVISAADANAWRSALPKWEPAEPI